MTIVDGIPYYDASRDSTLRQYISRERIRLIQKMLAEKKAGNPVQPATPSYQVLLSCGDHEHKDGLITVDISDEDINSNH
jgi:hypothetical protein